MGLLNQRIAFNSSKEASKEENEGIQTTQLEDTNTQVKGHITLEHKMLMTQHGCPLSRDISCPLGC